VISGIPVPDIAAYHRARYSAGNIVVAAAGNVDHDAILAMAEKLEPDSGSGEETLVPQQPSDKGRLEFATKDTEQYHVCVGAPGINRADERRFGLAVLDSILGGSSSSRLFIEVREKRGLAYSVGTYSEQFTDTGVFATYVGTREDNVEEACEVIGTELKRIQSEPVTVEELDRAKEHVKGRLVLSGESTAARMARIARATLHDIPLLNLDEMLARVDAVTVDDVSELASELYAEERLSAAAVGRDEDRFRAAIQPVSEALAA
jgi:predicted Zn-dependent peptidase